MSDRIIIHETQNVDHGYKLDNTTETYTNFTIDGIIYCLSTFIHPSGSIIRSLESSKGKLIKSRDKQFISKLTKSLLSEDVRLIMGVMIVQDQLPRIAPSDTTDTACAIYNLPQQTRS